MQDVSRLVSLSLRGGLGTAQEEEERLLDVSAGKLNKFICCIGSTTRC